MAEENKTNIDVVNDTMPGADPVSAEDKEGFKVDLNFEEVEPVEDETEEESEEEEVEFPAEEEVVEEEAEEEEDADTEDGTDQDEAEVPGEPSEEESEEPGDEDPTAIVEEEEVEKPQEPEKAPMVPKSRLDEVLAKNKKMQKQLDDIQQKEAEAQAEAPQYDFEAQEVAYQEAILDGDSAKASSIRQEIRKAEREQTMFEVQQQMGQSISMSQAEQELAVKAQEIQTTFAVLDENSADFDELKLQNIHLLRNAQSY